MKGLFVPRWVGDRFSPSIDIDGGFRIPLYCVLVHGDCG